MFPLRRRAVAVLVALLVTLVVGGCSGGDDGPDAKLLETPYDLLDGGTSRLATYAGRPVVVNFFGKWCKPCVAEMPAIETVHQEYADRVDFLGISTQESVDDARELVAATKVTYRIARDPDGQLAVAFGSIGMPTTIVFRADGSIAQRHTGALDEAALRAMIDKAL